MLKMMYSFPGVYMVYYSVKDKRTFIERKYVNIAKSSKYPFF